MSIVNALTVAARTRVAAAGVQVTYHVGGRSVSLKAIPTQPSYVNGEAPDETKYEALDWLVLTSSLVIQSKPVEPDEGHWIERVVNSVSQKFEVLPEGENCYRWLDSYNLEMTIHTKRFK